MQRRFLFLATTFLLAALSPGAHAVEPAFSVPTSAGTATLENMMIGAGVELSVASLQDRLRRLEAASKDDDSATEALRDYRAAIDQLQLAAEWKARAAALSRLQAEAPKLLDAVLTQVEAWSRQAPTPAPETTTAGELEGMLAEAEARLSVVRKGLVEVDAEQARIAQRRLELPAELATAGVARDGFVGELVLPPLPVGNVDATLARRAVLLATRRAAIEQLSALELELATHETRRELLTARRDLLRRQVDARSAQVAVLQAALASRRARESEAGAAEARADQESLARVHPVLGSLAEENARLATERTGPEGLTARLETASRELSAMGEQLSRLEERSKGVRQKVAAAGLTDAIGLLLRKEVSELPDVLRTRAGLPSRRSEIASVQLRLLNLEDTRKNLPGLEREVEAILSAQTEGLKDAEKKKIDESARNVLRTRRGYVDALIRDANTLFSTLVDLDARQAQYLAMLEEYRAYLDQHVLWIPNATVPELASARYWKDAAWWMVSPDNHIAALRRVKATALASPIRTGLALGLLGVLVLYRPRMKRLLAAACRGEQPGSAAASPAIGMLGLLLAAPGPLALWVLAWMLRVAPLPADDFSGALSVSLVSLAGPLLVLEFVRRAVRPEGPAEALLAWPRRPLAEIRAQVVVLETLALPAFLVAGLLDHQPNDAWGDSLGRAVFCFGVGAAGLSMQRLFGHRAGVVGAILRRTDFEWAGPLLARVAWLPGTAAALLMLLAVAGYYYTSFVLLQRVWFTSLLLLAFVVANAATLRWLESREQSRPDALEEEEGPAVEARDGDPVREAGGGEALARVSAQTRNLLRVLFGVGLAAGLFVVWADVFPALGYFRQIELWQVTTMVDRTVGSGEAARVETVAQNTPVTAANLFLALLGVALAWVGARNLPGLLELALLSRLNLDVGLRYAIAAVSRYAVFLAGAIMALANLGVNWSSVQWLVAAVSVGLGFGLQEIFGNFVSGLILLFERPVRVGDLITIDGMTGTVSRIEIRATTIVDFDRRELIVPNKELITGKLVNWSLHDPVVRLVLEVGVAYGSDTAAVERILLEVAKGCATVLEKPPPAVIFMRFGESSLDFELRVFVTSPDVLISTRHELMMAVDRRFRAAGIEIPFPQRDLHVRTVAAGAAASLAGRDPEKP